jgi:hypothetical protein
VDRKCTRHHWCSVRKFCKSGEINPSLHDLDSLLPILVLIRALPLIWLSCLRTLSSKVSRTSTVEATICIAWTSGCWVFGLGPFCCGVGGRALLCCWGGLAIQHPYWGAFWEDWGVAFCTKRYLCGGALEGPTGAFLFFSALWAMIQSSWVIAMFTSSL